ncbi:MAG TPA: hypothetical protein VFY91_14665, partial [Microbacterium sp.]|nr:hypothetical protein [Microbacterium sp.]
MSAPASPAASTPSRTADGPLTDAYRVIRAIAPPETPLEGVLARDGDDVVLLADAADLGSWAGWPFGREQHVLGPLDIARRPGGHVAVLPWCTERVDVFVGRRRAASSPLSGGEMVTLVVSALRGTAEAHRGREGDEASPQGSWWLTDAGRPVFVHGAGADVEAGARRIVEDVATGCTDRVVSRLLTAAMAALEQPRALASATARLEEALFEACAPQPLATTVFPAARVRDLAAPELRPLAGTAVPGEHVSRPLRDAIARHVDGELADVVAVTVGGAIRAVRGRLGRGRRAPWLAAAGIAGVIVAAGALWPTGDGPDPSAQAVEAREVEQPADPSTAPTPVSTSSPSVATGGDGQAPPGLTLEAEAGLLLDLARLDGSCRGIRS